MQNFKHITFTAITDVGKHRDHNEDSFVCGTITDSYILTVVIDGVGGYHGGEIASKLAADKITECLSPLQPADDKGKELCQAIVEANNLIMIEQYKQPHFKEMACVLTALLVCPEEKRAYMSHVGDTRLYEFSNKKLTKLSHDHSPIGILEEKGLLTEEEAMTHPRRNIIERCLGQRTYHTNEPDIENAVFDLKEGSTFLLCSDGLTDMVNSKEIIQILSSDDNLDEKAKALIDEANNAGGKDNVTVLLLHNPIIAKHPIVFEEALINNADIDENEAEMIPENHSIRENKTNMANDQEKRISSSKWSTCLWGLLLIITLGIIIWRWIL